MRSRYEVRSEIGMWQVTDATSLFTLRNDYWDYSEMSSRYRVTTGMRGQEEVWCSHVTEWLLGLQCDAVTIQGDHRNEEGWRKRWRWYRPRYRVILGRRRCNAVALQSDYWVYSVMQSRYRVTTGMRMGGEEVERCRPRYRVTLGKRRCNAVTLRNDYWE